MTSTFKHPAISYNRRFFLIGLISIITSLVTSGCSNTEKKLKILLLENSIPPQSIGDFRKTLSKETKIEFQSSPQLSKIYTFVRNIHLSKDLNEDKDLLPKLKKSQNLTNLATLGDSWLETAIKNNTIAPINSDELNNWKKLPQPWQSLVRRNERGMLDARGQIWGAPYRWGSVVIAYRKDKFKQLGWTPTDWDDLWREELGDRISLLDSPRETIGLTLKKLGYSYNTENLEQIPNLESELSALHDRVKLYSSDTYLQPLILGDTWLAVAWSADVLSINKRYGNIGFVIPESGTSLWTDLWVKPRSPSIANEQLNSAIAQWIDFCWQSKTAQQISLFTNGTSPILVGTKPQSLPESLQDNRFLDSAAINFEKSEFLLPLSAQTDKQYRDLWLKIRKNNDV